MFEECSTLAELSKTRQSLVRSGADLMEVNAAYNKAKKRLMEETPSFRKVPTYSKQEDGDKAPVFFAFPILRGQGKPNEIILTSEGVLL